jgi:protein tyrosine phosphatase
MTIEIPNNYYSLKAKIDYLRERKPEIASVKIPKLPRNTLVHNSTSEAVKTHAYKLLEYVEQKEKYDEELKVARAANAAAKPKAAAIEAQIEKLIEEEVGLTKLNLPEKKVAKFWQKAWDDASNEDEAISNLRELVELFED